MQKSLTHQEIMMARRKNSIMLAIMLTIIAATVLFAFGKTIFYVIAVIALPFVLVRIWEEVNRQYVSQKPQNTQSTQKTS